MIIQFITCSSGAERILDAAGELCSASLSQRNVGREVIREVGAFEAKSKLGQLLDLVEQGEEVTITRHGKAVAWLGPARPAPDRAEARAAVARFPRAPSNASSVASTGPNGRPIATKAVRESGSRQSATPAWICADETTAAIRALFERVADAGAVGPNLWRLEVANSLTVAVHRGRIDADLRRGALADLALLDIVVDAHTDIHAWGKT